MMFAVGFIDELITRVTSRVQGQLYVHYRKGHWLMILQHTIYHELITNPVYPIYGISYNSDLKYNIVMCLILKDNVA